MRFILKKFLQFSLLVLILSVNNFPVFAQEETASGPIYVVEEGDTLFEIAIQFGVTVEDLVSTNGLPNANTLFVGDRLVIPGLEGITGRLETTNVQIGENMRGLSRTYQIPMRLLVKLNRLVSPVELHRGASLVLTRSGGLAAPYRVTAGAGQSFLESAVKTNTNPWTISEWNGAKGLIRLVPGDVLVIDRAGDEGPAGLPHPIMSVEMNSLFQGETASLRLTTSGPVSLSGSLGPYNLKVLQVNEASYVSLQGIHAMLAPGLYPLRLFGEAADGTQIDFMQAIKVFPSDYIFEYLNVPAGLIDPETTEAENKILQPYLDEVTPKKLWDGLFAAPSPFEDCINSTFGNRRSYNGSAFNFYHSGVDYCGGTGVQIFAPAKGVVIFTGLLDVRGNYTLIDHGLGVLSAIMHQSEILVSVGDQVSPGDVIGLVGNTGRSTGPHLHWEVLVNGIPVDPLDWLTTVYP